MKKELQQLLGRNEEAQDAYRIAASAAENKNFRSFLSAYAEKRKAFANEIKTLLLRQGADAASKSSIKGSIRKAFMQLKVALPGTRDKMLLHECARFEARNLADYDDVLERNNLPNDVAEMLFKQRDEILTAEKVLSDISHLLKSEQINNL